MAFEDIIVSRATDHALSRLNSRLIAHQGAGNDSRPILHPQPTVLEPPFRPLGDIRDLHNISDKPADIIYESVDNLRQLCRCDIIPSSDYGYRWDKADIFLRHLPALYNRCGFEIIGNSKQIKFRLLCDEKDIAILSAAFSAKFLDCGLRQSSPEFFNHRYDCLDFRDYYGPGMYSHLFTLPSAFKVSVYETFLFVLSTLPKDAMGFCQVLFKATSPENNWHRNVKILTDAEYVHNMMQTPGLAGRYPQQLPSEDLRGTSLDVDTKSHPDKPFFGAALRIGVCGENCSSYDTMLDSLCSFTNLFRHGGRSLEYIVSDQYGDIDTLDMFERGLVYHPGILVNSSELCGLVHVPPIDFFKQTICEFKTLSPLFRNPMGVVSMDINKGTLIGYRQTDRSQEPFVLPDEKRSEHTHMIGCSGKGKSTTIANMALNEISRGHGITVIDPHGDLVNDLCNRIPKEAAERTILFDYGDDRWVPLYNSLDISDKADIGEAAGNIVSVLKSVFSDGWGMRMEHILKNLLYSLLSVKGMSFMELSEVLRKDSDKGKRILSKLIDTVQDEEVLYFLKHDFKNYRSDDLAPVIHRLSPLICSGTKSLSLLQPENNFDFNRIMDEGKILLVNLASLGHEHAISMGGFALASIYNAIRQRLKQDTQHRRPHNIYVDEAHLFQINAIEQLFVISRKCNVSFNLSHQYLSQFEKKRADSLLTTGTSIVFCVDAVDAAVMRKNFRNKPTDEDFMNLDRGEAMVRVDNDIAKITTLGPTKVTKSFREQIIRNSHRRYYKQARQIRRENGFRFRGYHDPFGDSLPDDLKLPTDSRKIGKYDSYE